MPIQARVKYWNIPLSFGHVAIEVSDLDSDRKFYLSWANGNSEAADITMLGDGVIDFTFSPNAIDFDVVFEKFKKSIYFLSVDSVEYVSRLKTPNRKSFLDLPLTDRNKFYRYGNTYSILYANCAHAVNDVLFWCNYLAKKPRHKFALRPAALACDVYLLILRELQQEERNVLNDKDISIDDKIKIFLDLLLRYLQLERAYCLANSLSEEVASLDMDILRVKNIAFDSAQEVEDIVHLVYQIRYFVTDDAKTGLRRCLKAIPAINRYEAQVELAVRNILGEVDSLVRQGYLESAETAKQLAEKINLEREAFFKNKTIEMPVFKKNVLQAVRTAKNDLAQHTRWEKILGNVVLAVIGLGIGFLIAGAIHKLATGRFLFFSQTKTDKCLNLVTQGLNLRKNR